MGTTWPGPACMAGATVRWRAGRRTRRTRTEGAAAQEPSNRRRRLLPICSPACYRLRLYGDRRLEDSLRLLERAAGLAWVEQAVRPHPAPQGDPRHAEHLGGALAVAGRALQRDADPARLRTLLAVAGAGRGD